MKFIITLFIIVSLGATAQKKDKYCTIYNNIIHDEQLVKKINRHLKTKRNKEIFLLLDTVIRNEDVLVTFRDTLVPRYLKRKTFDSLRKVVTSNINISESCVGNVYNKWNRGKYWVMNTDGSKGNFLGVRISTLQGEYDYSECEYGVRSVWILYEFNNDEIRKRWVRFGTTGTPDPRLFD